MVLGLLFAMDAEAGPSLPLTTGPARNPIVLVAVEDGASSGAQGFAPRRNVLGVTQEPSSVKLMQLEDQRPYGEPSQRLVWVARYEQVSMPMFEAEAMVNWSLAFDARTNELLCAFTDPAAQWVTPAYSTAAPDTLLARAGWVHAPAHHGELRSTLADVVGVVVQRYHVRAERTGQIVVRP